MQQARWGAAARFTTGSDVQRDPARGVPKAAYADFTNGPADDSLDLAAMRDALMKVLIHPIPSARGYTGQLSQHMVQINGQHFIEPEAVLKSMMRALLVIKHTLREDGHIYIVENHPQLKPLLHEAASCCLNPNVWWHSAKWRSGCITNYTTHQHLFKPQHQPNRRLFKERGIRMVNPHCPAPLLADLPVPRLSYEEKWALFSRQKEPGVRALLTRLIAQEDGLHLLKPSNMMKGRNKRLRLLVTLDATHNAVAIQEAALRAIPSISLVAHNRDLTHVTYPVLARDFHPAFVHFFLDWIVKVANVRTHSARVAAGGAVGEQADASAGT